MKKYLEIAETNLNIYTQKVSEARADGYVPDTENHPYVMWGVLHTITLVRDEETELDKLFDNSKHTGVYANANVYVAPVVAAKKQVGRPSSKGKY